MKKLNLFRSRDDEYWWICHKGAWWYSTRDMLGYVYQWTYCGPRIARAMHLKRSNELEYLILTGEHIGKTWPY